MSLSARTRSSIAASQLNRSGSARTYLDVRSSLSRVRPGASGGTGACAVSVRGCRFVHPDHARPVVFGAAATPHHGWQLGELPGCVRDDVPPRSDTEGDQSMSTPATHGLPRPRTLLAGAALSLVLGLGAGGSAHAATGPSVYADGLHVPAGGIVDPDDRVWVSDHNGGFCRLTTPDDRGAGTLDHPSTPGAPASVTRTCLGGLLPDAAPGPDAAGQPAFSDPTPELPGSGDELALVPDGASPSMDVWRARWNPHTRLFEADPDTDVIRMDADATEARPRPTAVSVAPDGNAYVVF